jgi:hypothetical protein
MSGPPRADGRKGPYSGKSTEKGPIPQCIEVWPVICSHYEPPVSRVEYVKFPLSRETKKFQMVMRPISRLRTAFRSNWAPSVRRLTRRSDLKGEKAPAKHKLVKASAAAG